MHRALCLGRALDSEGPSSLYTRTLTGIYECREEGPIDAIRLERQRVGHVKALREAS